MKNGLILMVALLGQQASAQVAPYAFHLGALRVTADATTMQIHTPVPVKVSILPGGHTWPLLTLDEAGNIYVGDSIIQSRQPDRIVRAVERSNENVVALSNGYQVTVLPNAYRIAKGPTTCTFAPRQLGLGDDKQPLDALKSTNIVFRASDRKLLALSTRLYEEKSDTRYSIVDIDLPHCRVRSTSLGTPDLLVELNESSKGGWWLTGSIEQTLLQSKNGKDWRRVILPKSLSSLISAYIVDPKNIWLAGMMPGGQDDDPSLIHTSDGGKHWKYISRTDPILKELPAGWLEGWRRIGRPIGK